MDAFIGRNKYESFLGREALHLRAWLPLNIRAFIAAVEYHYQVPQFVKQSGDPRLMGIFEGLVESYIGERGWMGQHRCNSTVLASVLYIVADETRRQGLWFLGSGSKDRTKRDER